MGWHDTDSRYMHTPTFGMARRVTPTLGIQIYRLSVWHDMTPTLGFRTHRVSVWQYLSVCHVSRGIRSTTRGAISDCLWSKTCYWVTLTLLRICMNRRIQLMQSAILLTQNHSGCMHPLRGPLSVAIVTVIVTPVMETCLAWEVINNDREAAMKNITIKKECKQASKQASKQSTKPFTKKKLTS